jgi:hypothetical protein
MTRYSSLAGVRGYNLLPVGGRSAKNEAVESCVSEIEGLLRSRARSKIYLTLREDIPAFRHSYF